jgi:L-alanine-DL-glutamate epimerase-like enolase superfamily enzyme
MTLQVSHEQLVLRLRDPFTLSYGTSTERTNVLVRVSDGRHEGLGEAALPPYYGETADRVSRCLDDPAVVAALDPAADLGDWLPALAGTVPSVAARAALEIALHDLWGRRAGKPLYRIWGHDPVRCPASSFTVAIELDLTRYQRRLHAARRYRLVKLKLGSGDPEQDLQLARTAREELSGQLAVDANGGWSADQALWIIPQLAQLEGLVYIEQPVARDDLEGWRQLRAELNPVPKIPPLIADESVQGIDSIARISGLADGINIKLVKCGGIGPARQMISEARAQGMLVMIGSMIESSVAVTAAAHLAPVADLADLDGNLLVENDPYVGVTLEHGKLVLPDGPGLGVRRRST